MLRQHDFHHHYEILGLHEPTHFPYNPTSRPDVLDIFLLRTTAGLHTIQTLPELNSDHSLSSSF